MITLVIGSKYAECRDSLREGIRLGGIVGLEVIAQNHACYCCVRRIQGSMYVIERTGMNSTEYYFLDRKCYEDARVFEYRDGSVVQ